MRQTLKIIALIGTLVAMTHACTRTRSEELVVWDRFEPFSADPMDFDMGSHHVAFRAVLAPLVTQYRVGQVTGIIASHWSVSPDFREWDFEIRPGLRFENGDPITAEVARKSLARVAYLIRSRASGASWTNAIVGIERLATPTSAIDGLRAEGSHLSIRLREGFPRLLDELGWGPYSIVNPRDYSEHDGKWKDPRRVTASGAYRIVEWTKTVFRLELRADHPRELRHPEAFPRVRLLNQPADFRLAAVVSDDSMNEELGVGYDYLGGAISGIAYVHCMSWRSRESPCLRLEDRIRLRARFYSALAAAKVPLERSFFPLTMRGIREFPAPDSPAGNRPTLPLPLKYRLATKQAALPRAFVRAMETIARLEGTKSEAVTLGFPEFVRLKDSGLGTYPVDFAYRETGILIDDSDSDVRFMFRSKEGIRLPDTDGSIDALLDAKPIDAQAVNQKLWDQAVIWPLGHFSVGLWVKKGEADVRSLNPILPPTDFSWIGRRSGGGV